MRAETFNLLCLFQQFPSDRSGVVVAPDVTYSTLDSGGKKEQKKDNVEAADY